MSENYPITKSSKSQVIKTRRIYRNEEWRPLVGFPGYEISNYDQVRSYFKRGRPSIIKPTVQSILSPHADRHGYKVVGLYKDGIRKYVKVHRLVLEAFIGPCPDGMEACHNDGNKLNNRLSNLRWDSRKNNAADRIKHGTNIGARGEKHGGAKLTEVKVLKIRKYYGRFSQRELTRIFNVSPQTINAIINNKRWKHI